MSRVNVQELTDKVRRAFLGVGVSEEIADTMAEVLVDTEMKGVFTHGIIRVPNYVRCIREGGIKPAADLDILSETPTMAHVSGHGGLGIPIAKAAMKIAIKKAKECGIGIVSVKASHHLGAVGYYANMAAEEGLIGMTMSNGNPMLAPTGSCEKKLGNNPFAYATPAGKYGTVLYDIAISATSDMKIIDMNKKGLTLPEGWLINSKGEPTTNPADYLAGGVLIPFGGYKGYGLALMVELLTACLGCSGMTHEVAAWNRTPKEDGGNVGHFLMAIDPKAMTGEDGFAKRAEELIDQMKASKLANGATEILYPGEKEKIKKAECLRTGYVDVNDDSLAALDALLKE